MIENQCLREQLLQTRRHNVELKRFLKGQASTSTAEQVKHTLQASRPVLPKGNSSFESRTPSSPFGCSTLADTEALQQLELYASLDSGSTTPGFDVDDSRHASLAQVEPNGRIGRKERRVSFEGRECRSVSPAHCIADLSSQISCRLFLRNCCRRAHLAQSSLKAMCLASPPGFSIGSAEAWVTAALAPRLHEVMCEYVESLAARVRDFDNIMCRCLGSRQERRHTPTQLSCMDHNHLSILG